MDNAREKMTDNIINIKAQTNMFLTAGSQYQ